MSAIELLSPAKDLECAIAAINCGADAVYIGSPRFSARAAAGNTLEDIEKAAAYAHRFNARLYVALNTILFNEEIQGALELIQGIYDAGADALIIQDMGLLELDLPPIPLIASTQTHNADWRKVLFLEKAGFQRIILARELALDEIREIRSHTKVELECFVHGAICVSYSGRCALSYAIGGRSGNRGVCAQPCRMNYSLKDDSGRTISQDKHLLSLKDLNLSEHLENLIDAGITSFKIEGRLKDSDYIKNVVSYYRLKLDKILEGTIHKKSSGGEIDIPFTPDVHKTFNRGYTTYFLLGNDADVASIDTQKSIGEPIGKVVNISGGYFNLEKGSAPLLNGDGICFFSPDRVLCGMTIDKVNGDDIYPHDIRWIYEGAFIYRNHDQIFQKTLKSARIRRKIRIQLEFTETANGFSLKAVDADGNRSEYSVKADKIKAEKPEKALQTIETQLLKLGDTDFICSELSVNIEHPYFLNIAFLNEIRRECLRKLAGQRAANYSRPAFRLEKNDYPYPEKELDFSGNVLNQYAEMFYKRHGVETIEYAAESGLDLKGREVMTTRYCIRRQSGLCLKSPNASGRSHLANRLTLEDKKSSFALEFDCARCVMKVIHLG